MIAGCASFAPAEQPRHIVVVMVEQSGVRQWGVAELAAVDRPAAPRAESHGERPLGHAPFPTVPSAFAKLVGDPDGVAAA
jgi:hypothetical protein